MSIPLCLCFHALYFGFSDDGISPPPSDFMAGCADYTRCVNASDCDCQTISNVTNEAGHQIFAYNSQVSQKLPQCVDIPGDLQGLVMLDLVTGNEIIECNVV